MSFTLTGDRAFLETVHEGNKIMFQDYLNMNGQNCDSLIVHVSTDTKNIMKVTKSGNSCYIVCQTPVQYFYLMNYLVHHSHENFSKEETPYFERNGFMLDCSRNAVATVETVKSLIRTLAKLGMNQLLLYTEDTYELPGEPYFGTYRGRYSQSELKELDKYASFFGIELVPCIQTLAHLRNFLKWPSGTELKDSADVLKVDSEKVYDFIERILVSLKNCFTTRRIHIGMDEAVMLGLGNYLRENGYVKSSVLIRRHSQRVLEICKKLGWSPMMWSDMYITANTGKGYYDINETTDTSSWDKPDRDMGLVYWDYYNPDEKLCTNMLRVHKELSSRVIFAGGIWNWNGIAPNYGKAIACTLNALCACQKQQIHDVFATGWLDNGAETPIEAIYPGLAAFAYLCRHKNLDMEDLKEEFRICIDGEWDDFYLLDSFDSLFQGTGNNISTDNPSKYLLYQDSLLGMFDYHIQGVDTASYYKNLAGKLEAAEFRNEKYTDLFSFYKFFALVLSQKADLGIRLKTAYDAHDFSALEYISRHTIPEILKNLQHMRMSRENLWLKDAKPFGYELLDIKLGGICSRLEAAKRRIESYLNHKVSHLEELEQERLPYWKVEPQYPHNQKIEMRENLWNRIISGCDLIDTI